MHIAMLVGALMAVGAQAVPATDAAQTVLSAIAKLHPGVKVGKPQGTPVKGLYRTSLDGTSGYISVDGRYFIVGDMYEVATRRNLSEEGRRDTRLKVLSQIDPGEAIVFAPPKAQHRITVFTDVDCGYCRKLHKEIASYNERGIAVRYLAYPRSGPDSESWRTMEAVWCAKDRRDAITRAKAGERVVKETGCSSTNLIARQYGLGQELGLQGTPMILLDDGRALGGYVPAEQLAQMLSKPSADVPMAHAGEGGR